MSREMLRRLARRELSPREIAELLRHIGECETCAVASSGGLQLDDDEGPWHPDHAHIAAYVDGSAGPAEREIVASHLDDCALCREDVADLGKLRLSRARRKQWLVAIAAAAAAIAVLIVILMQRPAPSTAPPVVTTQPPVTVTTASEPVPRPAYANAEWDRLVRNATETGRLTVARGIDVAPDVLRGPNGKRAADIAPSGIVIDDVRPRFSWPAREGATYVVSIFNGDERVAQSEPLTETHWTPAIPLARGSSYVWQVQATRDREREIIPAPPAPPAMFRIVSRRDHDELADARRLYPDDYLLHAVLAARAGLRDEALNALSRAHTNIRLY